MKSDTEKLSYEVYIAASPSDVWKGLTDGTLTRHYFYGGRVSSMFAKGAPITYFGDGDFTPLATR